MSKWAGLEYHSPLDVIAVLNHDYTLTMDRNAEADVFLGTKFVNHKASSAILFASNAVLTKNKLVPIDRDGAKITANKLIKALGLK